MPDRHHCPNLLSPPTESRTNRPPPHKPPARRLRRFFLYLDYSSLKHPFFSESLWIRRVYFANNSGLPPIQQTPNYTWLPCRWASRPSRASALTRRPRSISDMRPSNSDRLSGDSLRKRTKKAFDSRRSSGFNLLTSCLISIRVIRPYLSPRLDSKSSRHSSKRRSEMAISRTEPAEGDLHVLDEGIAGKKRRPRRIRLHHQALPHPASAKARPNFSKNVSAPPGWVDSIICRRRGFALLSLESCFVMKVSESNICGKTHRPWPKISGFSVPLFFGPDISTSRRAGEHRLIRIHR